MTAAIQTPELVEHEPLSLTLGELLEAITDVTQDDEEIAATLLHMVDTRRVRLITPPGLAD